MILPPENAPHIQKRTTNDSEYTFNVTRPKICLREKETPTYHFWSQSQCISSDKRCNTPCHEEKKLEVQTKENEFHFAVSEAKPYWMYRLRSMAENEAGNGPWSNWTEWHNTTSVTNTTKEILFATSSSDNSIILNIHPSCPYRGNCFEQIESLLFQRDIWYKIDVSFGRWACFQCPTSRLL